MLLSGELITYRSYRSQIIGVEREDEGDSKENREK